MAENLARVHGADRSKARLAGMLHDLARLYSPDRLLAECERRAMHIGALERANPILLHAPLSAQLASEDFGVVDPEVLSAIEKHTLADGQMSSLDCVLYLADGLEPGRDYPERASIARLAQTDLNEAMRRMLLASLEYLRAKQLPTAPQTLAAMKTFNLMEDATARPA